MLFDSHAHLNFKAFEGDLDEVIGRCQDMGMYVLNVGSQLPTSLKAVELARRQPGFFAAVGIHPIHIWGDNLDPQEQAAHQESAGMDLEAVFAGIADLPKEPEVVAIGETGLDYYRIAGDREAAVELQKEYFLRHIALARESGKPLVLHGRNGEAGDVYDDMLAILDRAGLPDDRKRGVIHCFGGSLEQARSFVEAGFLVGFTGIVTFAKKSEQLQDIARQLPLDSMLIETDCPYLAPEPHRGERNEPVYVEQVARKIAQLKNLPFEEVVEATAANARKLFSV